MSQHIPASWSGTGGVSEMGNKQDSRAVERSSGRQEDHVATYPSQLEWDREVSEMGNQQDSRAVERGLCPDSYKRRVCSALWKL
ncbi:hypothetical protein ACOMHN_027409 [Nucella lapillus]